MGLVVDTSALVSYEIVVMPAIVLAKLLVGVRLVRGRRAERKRASVEAFVQRAPPRLVRA